MNWDEVGSPVEDTDAGNWSVLGDFVDAKKNTAKGTGALEVARQTGAGLLSSVGVGAGRLAQWAGDFVQAPIDSTKELALSGLAAISDKEDDPARYAARKKDAQDAVAQASASRQENIENGNAFSVAGKGLNDFGVQYAKDAAAYRDAEAPIIAQQMRNNEAATGFFGTLKSMAIDNPLGTLGTVGESAADIAMGMGAGKAVGMARSATVAARAEQEIAALAKAAQSGAISVEAAATQAAGIRAAAAKSAESYAGEAAMLAESASSAGSTRVGVEQFINSQPHEKLRENSERYRSLIEQGASENQARSILARELSAEAALPAGSLTYAGGKLVGDDAAMGATLMGKGMTARQLVERTGKEAAQEMLQNPGENYAQYLAQNQADPSQTFDLGKSIAEGLVTGTAMGAATHGTGYAIDKMRATPADILAAPTIDDAIKTAEESLSGAANTVTNLLGRLDMATTNTGFGQAPYVAPVADLAPGGFAPDPDPVSTEAAYEQAAQAEEKARRIAAFEARQTGAGGDPVSLAIAQADEANTRQAAVEANPVIETAIQREVRKLREQQTARQQSEVQNGAIHAATNAEVATPSAQATGAELPGSASIPLSASVGDTGSVGHRAEVAASGVRPAVSAGTAGNQGVTTQIKTLQDRLEKTDPFSEESQQLTGELQIAVSNDAKTAIAAGEMPVYRVTDHVSVAIHPSAQNPGMVQVTRYTKDGVIGDSQYNNIDEAIRQEGLTDKPRISSNDAVKAIEQSIKAEAKYQQRKQGTNNGNQVAQAEQAAPQQPKAPAAAVKPKNQERGDLIGAIRKASMNGKGISQKLALTLTGDVQGGKLIGLFSNEGKLDLDDLVPHLQSAGYLVNDGKDVAALIRQASKDGAGKTAAGVVEEADANAAAAWRNQVDTEARELGLKGIGGRRTLEVVDADIRRVLAERAQIEADRAEMKEREKAAATLAEDVFAEGQEMSEADLMRWFAQQSVDYTQEEIDHAEQDQADREDARTAALAAYDSEVTAQNRAGERSQDGVEQARTGVAGEGTRGAAPSLTLEGQTNAQASAEYRAQQEEANRKDEAPASPTVKADQVDMFNTQDALFNNNREAGQNSPANEGFKAFVKRFADTRLPDTFTHNRKIHEISGEIQNDWSNGNSDDYSRSFGPDKIHSDLRKENAAEYYDADGDLTDKGNKRYNEIETALSERIARDHLGEPTREATDMMRPDQMAVVLHDYLESAGFSVSAISGSGKSQSKYFEVNVSGERKKVRIADHELPAEYADANGSADYALDLFNQGNDVRNDGRMTSESIDHAEAIRRAEQVVNAIKNDSKSKNQQKPVESAAKPAAEMTPAEHLRAAADKMDAAENTKESPSEPVIKTYPKAQAERMAKSFTGQGMPTEVYAHNGAYALRAPNGTQFSARRENAEKSLADVRQKIEQDGIKLDVSENNGTISISRIVVPEADRGNGKGTSAMQSIVDYADRTGQHITLSPSADFGGNKPRLIKFYKQFGFVENKGRNRAFSTSDSMYREAAGRTLYRTRSEQLIDNDLSGLEEQAFPNIVGNESEATEEVASEPLADAPASTDRTAATIQQALAQKVGSVPAITIHSGLNPAGSISRATFKAINAVAKIFKQRVVYFESDRPAADGFIHGGVIYLNVDSSVSPQAVLGHELTHRLQQEVPEAWQAVAQVMAQRMDQVKLIAMYRSYNSKSSLTDAQIIESLQDEKDIESLMAEMVSDYAGNQFTDESFWSDVFGQMAQGKPEGVVRKLVERLRLAVMKMVGLMNREINQPGFREVWFSGEDNTAAWGKDVNAALKSAYAQWIDAINTTGYAAMQEAAAAKFSAGREGREGEKFDASNPDIRFSTPRSAITGKNINQAWADQDNLGAWDNFVRTMQDKLIDTKRVVAEIRKAGIAVKDAFDPYLQEILYHGRAATRVHAFSDNELKPLLIEMQARGIEKQSFEDYLWARHAVERNVQIAKVNPKMPDGGSGLTNQQAQDILAGNKVTVDGRDIHLTRLTGHQSLAKRVDAITKETTDLLVSYGLETQETVDAWRATYGNYVPLMRDMESDDSYAGAFNLGQGTGQGFSVRGSAAKRAMGSEKGVIDILANVAMQRERAIVRGEKNRVSQALYGLTLIAPNPDFWMTINPDARKDPKAVIAELVAMGVNPIDAANIANEPKQQYVDPRTGMVAERVNPQLRNRDDVLAVRINGKDRYVLFSSDERAQQMVRNLKNLDAEQLGVALQNVAVATRWFSSINTQYNPVFGLTNGVRDLGSAALNLSSTELKNDRAAVLTGAFSALRGIYADLRDHRAGRPVTSKWAMEFEEFSREGGQTGYRDMFQTSQARSEDLAKELKNAGKGQRWAAWGERNSHIFGWLSDYNTSIENAVRLSAYVVAKGKGMSKQQAAALAKNLTVNFNKKGLAATQAGALFAFFNAAVQGTARIGETMVRIENGKPSLTKAGKTIMYGGMMVGVMQAVMFMLAGYDDENPPQFQREKNFIVPLPDGKFISIPYPLGFHVIPGVGRIAAEFALGGFKKPGKRLTDLTSMIFDGYSPIGGTSGGLTQLLAPTIMDPIVALSENKDWTGKGIYKEDFNKMHPTAGWTRKKDSSSDFSRSLAYGINYITGGGKYEIGMLSPTPDQIDYLIGQATGGVGREALKAYQFTKNEITGEDIPLYKVPVVGRFVGETTGKASETSRFYDNLKRIGEHKSALDEMIHAKDGDARLRYLIANPDARMIPAADHAQREISLMNKRKRELMEKDASRDAIKLIEMQITERIKKYNEKLSERQPGM